MIFSVNALLIWRRKRHRASTRWLFRSFARRQPRWNTVQEKPLSGTPSWSEKERSWRRRTAESATSVQKCSGKYGSQT